MATASDDVDCEKVRACEVANQEVDVAEIEKEFDRLGAEMAEPWKTGPSYDNRRRE